MDPSFKPAWWCRGAHAQTIAGALFRPRQKPRLVLSRKRYEMPDGDFLDLDFLEISKSQQDTNVPLVVIIHGLEGCSSSSYVQSLLGEIRLRGWRAVVINLRMCSGEPNRLKQTYHSGKTDDLDYIVPRLLQENPGTELYLVGYSIGGNILLKWLGEKGEDTASMIKRAAAVSVPYDLLQSVRFMDKGFNREVYTRSLLLSLKKKATAKKKNFPEAIRYAAVKQCRTFTDFDREVTAPLNGFEDEVDYWTKSSCKDFLSRIRVPALLIHAEDDPFFPGRLLPKEISQNSKFLKLLLTPQGGHLGFISGRWPWAQTSWLESTLLNYFKNENEIEQMTILNGAEKR